MVLQELSTRETDVIWLIVGGQGNKQIAVSLKLKESTVKGHVEEILLVYGNLDRIRR